jgi:hypothetical protein
LPFFIFVPFCIQVRDCKYRQTKKKYPVKGAHIKGVGMREPENSSRRGVVEKKVGIVVSASKIEAVYSQNTGKGKIKQRGKQGQEYSFSA